MVFQKYYAALIVALALSASAFGQATVVRPEGYTGGPTWNNLLNSGIEYDYWRNFAIVGEPSSIATNGEYTQLMAFCPDGVDWNAQDWQGGSTVLGELKAIRLMLGYVMQLGAFIAGMVGWHTFAKNIHV